MAQKVEVPQKLVTMLKARRVIPFVGAGFSAGLNLPDWDSLLARLADEIDGALPYAEVKKYCNGDFLQIAEYYLLVSDHRIGPLRHAIATALSTNNVNTLLSPPHVELVNLGAHQVYTTNYDDSIEKTFRMLRQPVEVVSLPKDVATATGAKTQVIKYHGDLRHENTLVLTESSYYARLDLESPMDLKFRSDLLGRSVLFMGYSFRDINIRIIWFRLMRMMQDIAHDDRPTSFIVTFAPNPVLERLYEEVGIETICLDPQSKATTAAERTKLLSDFMLELSMLASMDGTIPGQPTSAQFYSGALGERINSMIVEQETFAARLRNRVGYSRQVAALEPLLAQAARRIIPPPLKDDVQGILSKLSAMDHITPNVAILALNYGKCFGANPVVTYVIARALGGQAAREAVLEKSPSWSMLWGTRISRSEAEKIVQGLGRELTGHEDDEVEDHDIAFLADVVHRIISGEIFDASQTEVIDLAKKAIAAAAEVYSSIGEHKVSKGAAPDVGEIIHQIDEKYERLKAKQDDDEVPF